MTTLREAAQQALEALEDHATQYPHMQKGYTVDAIAALRDALAQQAEPAPGWCKHCKQYSIEEPLPAQQAEPKIGLSLDGTKWHGRLYPSDFGEPVDQTVMELAESVGLIGPASRTHDLHGAIQRFHDLVCAEASIKAAQQFAVMLAQQAEPVAQYSDIVSDGGMEPRNKFDTLPAAQQAEGEPS